MTSSDHARRRPAVARDPRVDLVSFTGSTATGRKVMAAGGRDAEEGVPRAGRQVRLHRPRRRRHRRRPRRWPRSRSAPTPARAAPSPPACSCPRDRYDEGVEAAAATMAALGAGDPTDPGTDLRAGHLGRPARADRGLPAPRRSRRAAPSPAAAAARPTASAASSSSRPWWSASTTTPASPARRSSARCWSPSRTTATTTPSASPTTRRTACRARSHGGDLERALGRGPRASAPAPSASTAASGTAATRPFGGYKQSGIGREMGVVGFEEYLETKTVAEPA